MAFHSSAAESADELNVAVGLLGRSRLELTISGARTVQKNQSTSGRHRCLDLFHLVRGEAEDLSLRVAPLIELPVELCLKSQAFLLAG